MLQLLEIVNRSLSGPEDMQGIVVANDSDTDRAYMLGEGNILTRCHDT